MSVIDTLITDRTQSDVSNGTEKGYYNTSDLNRVSEAMEYLVEQLWNNGYSVPGYVKGPVWSVEDIPTPDQMEQYLTSVSSIRAVVNVLKPTPNTPDSMENLTYEEANNIEQILLDVETMLNAIVAVFPKSGQSSAFAGNVFYFLDAYYGEQISKRIAQNSSIFFAWLARAQTISKDSFSVFCKSLADQTATATVTGKYDLSFSLNERTGLTAKSDLFSASDFAFIGHSGENGSRAAQTCEQKEIGMEQEPRFAQEQTVDNFGAVQIGASGEAISGFASVGRTVEEVRNVFLIGSGKSGTNTPASTTELLPVLCEEHDATKYAATSSFKHAFVADGEGRTGNGVSCYLFEYPDVEGLFSLSVKSDFGVDVIASYVGGYDFLVSEDSKTKSEFSPVNLHYASGIQKNNSKTDSFVSAKTTEISDSEWVVQTGEVLNIYRAYGATQTDDTLEVS